MIIHSYDPIDFKKFVSEPDKNGCTIWLGKRSAGGYGLFKSHGAHRVSWMLNKGEIPKGLFVCHKCDIRECVNIDHLFLGTNKDNMNDMRSKGRHNRQLRTCAECGKQFKYSHHSQQFCCSQHQTAFHNLWSKRGRLMGPLAAVMRMGKRGYNPERKYALKEFCALMDQYHREDRKAGRLPEEYVARKLKRGWTAADSFTPERDTSFKPGRLPKEPDAMRYTVMEATPVPTPATPPAPQIGRRSPSRSPP